MFDAGIEFSHRPRHKRMQVARVLSTPLSPDRARLIDRTCSAGPAALRVICGGGTALELLDLQLEGKKRIGGEAIGNGQRLQENESLGGDLKLPPRHRSRQCTGVARKP
jgi:hypothetical protein